MADRPATQYETLIHQVNRYKESMVRMGHWLERAKENRELWIGGEMSWTEFLAQPEIGMTVREANGLIKLVEWLRETKMPFDETNLGIAKFAANKDITDESLASDMMVLSLKDFKERHHDVKKGQDNAPQTYEYMVMKRSKQTGNLSRVYDDNADKLIEKYKDSINAN